MTDAAWDGAAGFILEVRGARIRVDRVTRQVTIG